MRVDKWLWSIRMYKTRSIAADACKNNRIMINGQLVKSSREVKIGDIVQIKKMPVIYSFKVIEMLKGRQSAKNVPLYAKNVTPQEELDKLNNNITLSLRRDRGTGRPTKKERREIDYLMGDFSGVELDEEQWDEDLDSMESQWEDDIDDEFEQDEAEQWRGDLDNEKEFNDTKYEKNRSKKEKNSSNEPDYDFNF